MTRDPSAYDSFWSGPGASGASTFDVEGILITTAIVVVIAAIFGSLAAWKHRYVESAIESTFEAIGRCVGTWPLTIAVVSFVIFVALSAGMPLQEGETDAAKLWVPEGAIALDHSAYTRENWPSSTQATFMVAMPKDGEPGPNVLTKSNLLAMLDLYNKLMAIEVDGDKIVEDSKDIADYTEEYGGTWTFDGRGSTRAKCSKWGPACAMQSVLAIFDYNELNIGNEADILDRINKWDAALRETDVPGLNLYKNFEVADVMGGISRDANGKVVSAQLFMWSLFFTNVEEEVNIMRGGRLRTSTTDPVNDIWEADAICFAGVVDKHPMDSSKTCEAAAGDLKYTGLFGRSFGDEFGAAISNDATRIGMAYGLIVVYLVACLGKRDVVHSMVFVSAGVLVAVGLAFTASSGFGGILGIKTNPLNNNIPFLLLGLGVDDAFVLVAELTRHMAENKDASIPDLIALTAKSGGSSILITSITDALAFLVGASTSLPALSGFCLYGGVAVLMCFILQLVWVLPLLALNIRRAQDNRYDCLCCLKSSVSPHEIEDPQGCCCCYAPTCKPTDNIMRLVMGKVGDVTVKTMPGKIGTLIFWMVIFGLGLGGAFQVKKDFKLEWFFPAGSYVGTFIAINDEYFSTGTRFSVYTNDVDVFTKQDELNELTSYLKQKDFIRGSSISNWWENFRPDPTVAAASTSEQFYQDLWDWARNSDYKTSIRWVDPACNKADTQVGCDPTKGISHTRITATLKRLGDGVVRYETMSMMRQDINDIFDDQSSMKVFPFAQDFLYWEENGVIDTELVRNLVIAGGIVFVILCTTIPKPRIAVIVSLGICVSVLELVGFIHYWGVTINGTTTIYTLICLGLAVDYSAHIGHIFNLSVGSAQDRAWEAMTRIGPSVFHAVFSTILAVIVLSASKSYVFEVFFKVLCVVTLIAGFKGLWLLPVVLSLVGGDQEEADENGKTPTGIKMAWAESNKDTSQGA